MTLVTTRGYALTSNEGTAHWMLGAIFTVKAGAAQTGGAYSLIEFQQPAGTEPPPHTHANEDEAFYVLEGEMTVMCGDDHFVAGPGSFVYLPKGVVHGFTITGSTPLRGLVLTSPGAFDEFVAEMGEPALARTMPAPAPPDLPRLVSLATKYGIDLHLPGA